MVFHVKNFQLARAFYSPLSFKFFFFVVLVTRITNNLRMIWYRILIICLFSSVKLGMEMKTTFYL